MFRLQLNVWTKCKHQIGAVLYKLLFNVFCLFNWMKFIVLVHGPKHSLIHVYSNVQIKIYITLYQRTVRNKNLLQKMRNFKNALLSSLKLLDMLKLNCKKGSNMHKPQGVYKSYMKNHLLPFTFKTHDKRQMKKPRTNRNGFPFLIFFNKERTNNFIFLLLVIHIIVLFTFSAARQPVWKAHF